MSDASKAGARHSASDQSALDTAHDAIVRAGALCATPDGASKIAARQDVSPKEGVNKYGNVTFADPKNKKYPIDTEAHIRAAYNYISKPKNRAKYAASDAAAIRRRIIAAWRTKIDKAGPPSASDGQKALSLTDRVQAVTDAIYDAAHDAYPDDADSWYVAFVYDDYAICKASGQYYQVPYTLDGDDVTVPPMEQWQAVQPAWAADDDDDGDVDVVYDNYDADGPTTSGAAGLIAGMGMKAAELPPSGPSAVKFLDKPDRVGAYAVVYGDADHPDLSPFRDFFTKDTDFWLGKFGATLPHLFHHAQDPATKSAPVIGTWDTVKQDDTGLWVEGILDRRHKYYAAVKELIKRGALSLSSDSIEHLVVREPATKGTHRLVRWPFVGASSTPEPAEPRLLPVSAIKAAYQAAGLPLPDAIATDDPTSRAASSEDAGRARRLALEIDILALEIQ